MLEYDVIPHVGAGPVRLGMHRDEVRRVMASPVREVDKSPGSGYLVDAFHESGFQVFYAGAEPVVDFIELWNDPAYRVVCRGVPVFELAAVQVVEMIAREHPFDPDDPELGITYRFPSLDLAFWRPYASEDDDDPEGRGFSTVAIGRRGYFGG